MAVPGVRVDEEDARLDWLGPIGEAPFCDLQLEPWPASGSAIPSGSCVRLSQAVPLACLCESLAKKLSVQSGDITILEEKRVLDNGMTVRDNGIAIPDPASDARIKLAVAVACEPARSRTGSGTWLEKWNMAPPPYLRRPSLSEMPHLVTESASSSWIRAGSCTTYGPRVANEDAHVCCCDWAALSATRPDHAAAKVQAGLFAVCDGHGGSWTSQRVAEYLADELRTPSQSSDWWDQAARRAAVESGFVALDQRLAAEGGSLADNCGSTCIAAIIWPAEVEDRPAYRLLFANLGDSRGFLHRRGPDELVTTWEHKPDDPREKRRIRAAGGWVLPADPPQPARLDGTLAMSRAFGDARFKAERGRAPSDQKVSALPEVFDLTAEPGDTVVLACDGVFDVLESAQVAALVARVRESPEGGTDDPVEAASTVVWAALQEDTQDNATCLVVHLPEIS